MQCCSPFLASLFLGATALAAPALASEGSDASWPQWLGPNFDALTRESDWSAVGAEADAWRLEVGLGYSSVVVANGRLYTKGYDKEAGLDLVWCVDAATGEELWVQTYEAKIWNQFHTGGTLSTPTLDGDTVFVLNREGRLHALDAETGDVRWERTLTDDHELTLPTWGFAASPLVSGDELLLNVGPVLAVDKRTGKDLWQSADYGHAYSTPRAFERGGRQLLAVFNGDGLAILENPGGAEVALHAWKTDYDVNAATPILLPDGGLFISSGYNHGCGLLDLTDDGLKVRWENKRLRNKMSGSVLIDDHLYGFDDKQLVCLDLQGETLWKQRGLGDGALMGSTDGRLIVLGGDGALVIAKADPEGYAPQSEVDLFEGGVCWTRPVLVAGRIYARNSEGTLVCRDHRPAKAE